ncbi:MAG TPA: phosphotransferase [Candidatus Hydrogenedentes bacterium]|nr:phosphotransferase [Candidatus Hydrogenedentota bacterium]
MSKGGAEDESTARPVFGLSEEELRPIVDSIAREPVASFCVSIEHEMCGHYGYSADKLIPTFIYTTKGGQKGKKTIFVKRFREPGAREAHHYANLEEYDAPIPRMYGFLTDADDREICFLEYLEPVDALHPFHDFVGDYGQFTEFLAAIAHFNTIQPSGEYAAGLPRDDFGQGLREAIAALERIWVHGQKGELGVDLRAFCSGPDKRLERLKKLAEKLMQPVAAMKAGLCHNDFAPDSTAYRRDTGKLLIFDLEYLGFGPRFRDVAHWLGAPEDYYPRCRPRHELARLYLRHYVQHGGQPVPVKRLLEEAHILWQAQTLSMLWWLNYRAIDGLVDWTEDRDEGRRTCQDDLRKQLSALCHEAS